MSVVNRKDDEGARQVFEQRLEALLHEPIEVSVTNNRRAMLSTKHRPTGLLLRVHHMFLDADDVTLRALAKYVRRPGDRAASKTVGLFIDANRDKIKIAPEKPVRANTRGTFFELREIFDEMNQTHFSAAVDVAITWGRPPTSMRRRRTRRSMKLGSYSAEQKLIRIHPALDREYVPRYFVEYVIFHEMLHHVVPAPVRGSRRMFHTAEFRMREKLFPHYERAMLWEKNNVGRLMSR